jgi:hypothetical protein
LQKTFSKQKTTIENESFPTREAAVEEIVDRLVSCPGKFAPSEFNNAEDED